MTQVTKNTNDNQVLQLNPGNIYLLPTRVIDNGVKNENEEDLSDFSSEEENINSRNSPSFVDHLEQMCDKLGYDLDGRLQPDDVIYESAIEAANFSPFVIVGDALELEAITLWDYCSGNTFADLNVFAGETVYAVAEEYKIRCINHKSYIRLPYQWSLARRISGRPVDPYLAMIPSCYIVSKKFYHENPLLFRYPVWFQGNSEIDQVLRVLYSDRSALCPGLFAIFSPPWLNPDPRDLRCYFLMLLVARAKNRNKLMMDMLKAETNESRKLARFVNDKLAACMRKQQKTLDIDENLKAVDFLCEIEATPYSPMILTITRSQLGHYELMANRYDTLYDLVFYLANHRSTLPHRLVFDRLSPDVVQPKPVPPPVTRFEPDLKAQPMTIEQWAAIHFDQLTAHFEYTDKFAFVTKSIFDSGKKVHEKMLKKLDLSEEDHEKISSYVRAFSRPKDAPANKKKPVQNGRKSWNDLPPHESVIHLDSLFYINLDRVKCARISLGAGAFGSVEIGTYTPIKSEPIQVAIKKLKLMPNKKEERNQVFSEIEVLQSICHPNIVLFYGFSIESKSKAVYLLFELMETALDKFVEKSGGKMSENERLDILAQICRGMSYLHTRTPPIVHGDLAARNILLKKHPNNKKRYMAKVTDFGLAKPCRDDLYTAYSDPNKIPFKWLPPEVLGPRILSAKSDVWAFGMICLETYGIGEPYGILPAAKVYQYLNDGYRFDKLPGMSPCILEIALECWRKQPVDRPHFGHLEKRLSDWMIEEDEDDDLIYQDREKEMLAKYKQEKQRERINRIVGTIGADA